MVTCKTKNCRVRSGIVDGYCPKCVELRENTEHATVAYKCGKCDKPVDKDQNAMCCDYCSIWFHIACISMPQQAYDLLFSEHSGMSGIKWYCGPCEAIVEENLEKIKKLETKTDALQTDVTELKSQVARIEKTITTQVKNTIYESMSEKQEIEKRKLNLIVYGLPEPKNPGENTIWDNDAKIKQDTDTIETVIKNELGVGLSPRNGIYDAKRLGLKNDNRARPLRITFDNIEVKRDVLTNAKKLRQYTEIKDMYISPDLTPKQREYEKELREQMWKRRSDGENCIIKRGAVITVDWEVNKTRPKKRQ